MLRRRPPPKETVVSDDQEPPQKQFSNGKKANHISLRVLASTLSAAVLAAVNPEPDVRSQAYSEYLTTHVHGLTIGWHVFRTVTEGAFLASYGLAFNTLVVQVFWSMSVGSVLMYFVRRSIWMNWRESICVWTNIIYGVITVLKIFHLLDRLPNENHYMFKHCFLTMADAAFSQTPVHKQYAVQFAEAVIRVIVWRRYNVLANTPTSGVIIISLAWQIWLVTFSSMLQARHVSTFRRLRCASGSSNPAPTSTPVTSRPASCEVEPVETCTPCASTSTGPTPPLPALAAETLPSSAPGLPNSLRPVRNRRSSIGASTTAAAGTAAVAGAGSGARASCMQSPTEPLRLSSTAVPSSQKRFMRALRGVARGPSSYVLLSHQRRQVGGTHIASAQFYIPAANPDMLSGTWRERLTLAIAEGAPGWQVSNMCVRKGSLIVHLDLVYAPRGREAADVMAASPAITGPAALPDGVANNRDVGFPGVSYSEQPFDTAGACNPKAVLDEYIDGMGAESLLQLLGLDPDLPAGPFQPISVQVNDKLWNLPIAPDTTAAPCTSATTTTISNSAIETIAFQVEPETVACNSSTAALEAAPGIKSDVAPQNPVIATSAGHEAWIRLVLLPLQTAMRPPAELRSSEYNCFLSERVAALHLSYAAFICLTAVALPVVREVSTVNPVTLFLFISTELLTLASHVALGRGPWRSMRCGLVYAGVAIRTLQMAACTSGFLPHVLRDSDCISGRWIQKVMLITTLQALCMQSPVRSFFLVRMPSVMLSIYVHVFVCQTGTALQNAAILHLGWEGLLFYISAIFQLRHLEAFHRRRNPSGCCQQNPVTAAAKCAAEDKQQAPLETPALRVARNSHEETAVSAAPASGKSTVVTPASSIQAGEDGKTVAAAATVAAFVPAAAPGDPCDVSIDTPTLVMAPRRAARLQLHFTCAPAIVEELQVVLRHINPVAMSSGVHSAHTVRDITRALVAPAGAAAAPLHVPAPFAAELTLVASPADMPGLVHVELWRGRRRVCSLPVLLVATPELPRQSTGGSAPRADMSADSAYAVHMGIPGAEGAVGRDNACFWLDDVRRYVGSLRDQGHIAAADQFVEELGTWLAQAAALERGLTGSQNVSTQRVANVLYFHGYGSEFMYVKPRRVSGCGGRGDEAAAAAAVPDPLQDTLRQLLLCQGSMLVAVAVEAGCIGLSEHLVGLLMGEIGATLRGLLETRTPVTQLPLLHAAVKSGDPQMVDLIAEWSTSCGLKDIWANEAAVLAVSLESRASSAVGDTASLGAALQFSTGTGGSGFAAARRPSRLLPHVAQDISRRTSSTFRVFEVCRSGGLADAPADAGAEPRCHSVAGDKGSAESTNPMVAMDNGGSSYTETADSHAGPDLDKEGNDVSDESPFKIINFRASNRPAVSSMVAVGSVPRGGSSLASSGEAVTGLSETVVSDGSRSNLGLGGGSSSGLVDGGVLVLTPLHIALALGDEGRLANHILRTYPEAYELWRTSQLDMEVESAVNVGGGSSVRLEVSTSAADSLALSPQPLMVTESIASSTVLPANLAAVATAYSSMPGLISLAKASSTRRERRDGGDGMDADGASADDAMDVGSMKSISLSEVAFYEGIRWVNEDAPARRPGFEVVRM